MKNQIKILLSGDFCPIGRSENFINEGLLEETFGDILHLIRESDIAITNLECPLVESAKAILKTGPNLKASVNTASFLRNAGFTHITLANNHIMDYGDDGLTSTINAISEVSLNYIGAGGTLQEARRIFYRMSIRA